jgi:chromosome segregation ATPase
MQKEKEAENLQGELKNNQSNVEEVERLQSHVREQQRRIEQLESILRDCRQQVQDRDTAIDKYKKQCQQMSARPNSAEIRQNAAKQLDSENSRTRISFLEIENQRYVPPNHVLSFGFANAFSK